MEDPQNLMHPIAGHVNLPKRKESSGGRASINIDRRPKPQNWRNSSTSLSSALGVALRVRNLASSSSFYHRAMEVDMVRKRDRFWEYAEHLDGRFKCKFCDKIFAGGVPRVKSHLSGIKGGGIDICTKVPEDVRVAIAEAISGSAKEPRLKPLQFILLNDVDVDIVWRPSFIDFVNGLAEHGSHYKLPCCSVVKAKLVPDLEKEIERADNIVQCITSSAQAEGLFKIMPNDNHSHVYETNCVAQEIHLLFEDIYNGIEWVRKTFDQARAVVIEINKHNGILSSMKQVTNNRELKQSSRTKFYSSYYMLQSIMGVESELQLLVSSSEWLSSSFEKHELGKEVGKLICSSEFWIEGKEVLHALKSIFQVLHLVDSYGATSGFLYAAVKMADEAIKKIYETNVQKYQRLWDIFRRRQSCIIHPIHAAAAFLNPAYMCSEKFIENNAMKQGIYFILEKLVGGEEKEKFLQDKLLYCKKVPELFTCSAMTMLRTSHPCDWWDYCGDALPVLKKYAIRILSQPCSTLSCRQSLSAFETAQIEKMEPLMPAVTDNYLYLRINALLMENFNTMKGKIRKPLDLEKLGELPDCTEFINENFSRDLLNVTKVPLSDGKLNFWSASARKDGIRVHEGTSNAFTVEDANTGKSRIGSLVEPSSMEVTKQLLSSRPHCQIGNASPVVSRSFGDAQEAACSRVNDAVSVPPGMRRCEKSCRLSWINDLKPDLNRPAFSLEEENLIFQLHALLGNRWSEIAARLPGRTDKEIKDFLELFPKKEAEAKRD
ncbi:hypothetical protein NL676_008735 [Syzygium grande]|nr:hypothetical protein NL676_008735 [Syzygium grande]